MDKTNVAQKTSASVSSDTTKVSSQKLTKVEENQTIVTSNTSADDSPQVRPKSGKRKKIIIIDLEDSSDSGEEDLPQSKRKKITTTETETETETDLPSESNTKNDDDPTQACAQQSIASSLVPEVFIEICKNLPPQDLLTLSRVCRLYTYYLCSKESTTSESIWRESRLQYLDSLQLPPLGGLSEYEYCRVALEQYCQICGADEACKVHWEFLVRCCDACFKAKTIQGKELFNCLANPSLLYVFPRIQLPNTLVSGSTFWKPQVTRLFREYDSLATEKQNEWVKEQRDKTNAFMGEVKMRRDEERKHHPHQYDEEKEGIRKKSSEEKRGRGRGRGRGRATRRGRK